PFSYAAGDWLFALQRSTNPVDFIARINSIPLMRGPGLFEKF
ncbi:hypothetical protein LCGC14_3169840, partial [marine sediment metagenome]